MPIYGLYQDGSRDKSHVHGCSAIVDNFTVCSSDRYTESGVFEVCFRHMLKTGFLFSYRRFPFCGASLPVGKLKRCALKNFSSFQSHLWKGVENMLQIKNLTVTHRRDLRTIIDNFSICLNDGDKIAVIGEEGNGKSTLLKLIYDCRLVEDYVEYTGEILTGGATMGYLAQEMRDSDREKSVYEYCLGCRSFLEQTPKELAMIAGQLKIGTEFFYSEQSVESLSGGEKVKLQMAHILMDNPDILLLDEPTNDIDMDTVIWLEHFIRECMVPVIYISHDETLLENTANRIIHMEQIRRKTIPRVTVCRMGYAEYVKRRDELFAHQAKIAKMERSEYAKQQEKLRRIQQKVEHQQEIITRQDPQGARLLKKKMHAVKSQERRFEKQAEKFSEFPDTEEAIFISFKNGRKMPNGKLVLEYDKPVLAVKGNAVEETILSENIRFQIAGPEKVCIIGKNGVGKSTMLKDIAGKLLERKDIRVFYMPQNYEELLDMEQSPVDYLTKSGDREENVRICTYLGSMKFTADEMHHRIGNLSGGQKAKLLFLKMTMGDYDVLLLDEPTRNLSPLSGPVVRGILEKFPGAICSVSHDRKYLSEVCTKIYELERGGLFLK